MDPFSLDATGDDVRLSLSSVLDIRVSEAMKDAFLEAITLGKKVVIDASEVERISTPCIQVLLSAVKTMDEKGLEFSLFSPTEVFVDAFNDLGLFPVLMKWKVEN